MNSRPDRLWIGSVALLCLLCAAPAQPKSLRARTAIKKFERSVDAAQMTYDRAVAAARKELRAEMDAAIDAAMRAKRLDDAKAIEAARDARVVGKLRTNQAADGLVGTWRVTWTDGSERTYEIDAAGDVAWGDKRRPLQRRPGSGGVVTDPGLDGASVERFTRAEDRLLVELFKPAAGPGSERPALIGIGVLVNDQGAADARLPVSPDPGRSSSDR
jgi:hypothetical protein